MSCVASRNEETKLSLALLIRQVFQLPLIHGHREGKPLEQGVGWPEGRCYPVMCLCYTVCCNKGSAEEAVKTPQEGIEKGELLLVKDTVGSSQGLIGQSEGLSRYSCGAKIFFPSYDIHAKSSGGAGTGSQAGAVLPTSAGPRRAVLLGSGNSPRKVLRPHT